MMQRKFGYFWLSFLFFVIADTYGQRNVLTFRQGFDVSEQALQSKPDSIRQDGFQPQITSRNKSLTSYESIGWLRRKLFHEHFLVLDTSAIHITVDPVFNFEFGRDIADKSVEEDKSLLYKNTRGVKVAGTITRKVGFTTSFYENQSRFPDYLSEYIVASNVVPGQGRVKQLEDGFDYAMATASVFYTPDEHIQLIAGHGKHFIGEGYRSLFLSDNAFNYPYARANLFFRNKKIAYTFLLTSFQDLYRLPVSVDTEPPFMKKTGNFHYLSWIIGKHIRLGFFEGGYYQSTDTLGRSRFQPNSLNPLIGSGLLNSKDSKQINAVGMDIKVKVAPSLSFYSQALLSETNPESPAFQVGLNWGKPGYRYVRLEYNQAPVTTKLFSEVNTGHYNQSLAHPSGEGFREILGMAYLRKSRFFGLLKINYIDYQEKVNLDLPVGFDLAYYPGTDVVIREVGAGWIINPSNGMNVRLGAISRSNYLDILDDTTYIYFGFRTCLPSTYYDF